MAFTNFSGPVGVWGNMDYLGTGYSSEVNPAYNPNKGPSWFFQGTGFPDTRFLLQKDKPDSAGIQPMGFVQALLESANQIPAANGAATLVAAAHTTNGTAMTLKTTQAAGIAPKVPFPLFSGQVNGGAIQVSGITLDFGFAFGTFVTSSKTVAVADSTKFTVGMPLVCCGAGASGAALLTWVTGLTDATHITINDTPLTAINPGAIGTGNNWPGAPLSTPSQQYPTGHMPYLAGGPGLLLDPGQCLTRGVSVTCNNASGTGGNIVVSGWDIYGQPMNETINIAPATALVTYGLKAFKHIKSVTSAFTDGTYTYSVGTSDNFGFNYRSDRWEQTQSCWNALLNTAATGWTGWVAPASGDVRGTLQVSGIGPLGSGIGSTQSNGTISTLAMSGHRLYMAQRLGLFQTLQADAVSSATVFGATQT
jgi:hypothetical protein